METRPKRLFSTVPPQNILVHSQQSLAFFSAGEPASVFTGTAGVVAGTDNFVMRRWNGKGGGRRWGPGIQVSGAVSSGKVLGLVSGYVESDFGNMQFCGPVTAPSGAESEFSDTQFCGALASPSGAETDLHDAQFCGAVVAPSGTETEMKVAQFCGAGAKSGLRTARSRCSMVASSGPLHCADPGKGDAWRWPANALRAR